MYIKSSLWRNVFKGKLLYQKNEFSLQGEKLSGIPSQKNVNNNSKKCLYNMLANFNINLQNK